MRVGLGWVGLYWVVLGCTVLYWVALGCTGLYCVVLCCTVLLCYNLNEHVWCIFLYGFTYQEIAIKYDQCDVFVVFPSFDVEFTERTR